MSQISEAISGAGSLNQLGEGKRKGRNLSD